MFDMRTSRRIITVSWVYETHYFRAILTHNGINGGDFAFARFSDLVRSGVARMFHCLSGLGHSCFAQESCSRLDLCRLCARPTLCIFSARIF